jgi:ectoine hydroxylase-related dioxygenase (phytanoyl-CoA dioxygenase family)
MSDDVRGGMEPVPTRPGDALAFSLSLIHGQEVNASPSTRFSTDIRLVNSFAPIQWQRTVHADYYEPLVESPVAEQARRYYAANKEAEAGADR